MWRPLSRVCALSTRLREKISESFGWLADLRRTMYDPGMGGVGRRSAVLSAAALCSSILNGAPDLTAAAATEPDAGLGRLVSAVRGGGYAGLTDWGQPWSNTCSWSASPEPAASTAVVLPRWLQGRWRVTSAVDGVSFPLGRKFLSEAVPGYRMVSILPLPNVGAAPTFEVQFDETPDAQRAANAKATLEAFWPSATVVDVSAPREGFVRLRYSSPTKAQARVTQAATLALCSSEGGSVSNDVYVLGEVFRQDNEDQATRGEFIVITEFEREGDDRVRARQRVAAFLQPTDGRYLDAQGKPVALYDYTFRYSRLAP